MPSCQTHWIGWLFFMAITGIGLLADGVKGLVLIWSGVIIEVIYLGVQAWWEERGLSED